MEPALSFEQPRVLLFLLVLIPLFVVQAWRRRGTGGLALWIPSLKARRFLGDTLFLLAGALLILALAGPRWGYRYSPEYRRGLDLVLAIDLSRSMLVRDCPPSASSGEGDVSRLEEGLALAKEVCASLGGQGGGRIGAAIGKGRGVLALPLTWDTETVLNFLGALGTYSITGRGTNLERLVDAATGAFRDNGPGRRCILLLSDGEGHEGSLQAAMERAVKKNIFIVIVGLGSDAGGPVPGLESGGKDVTSSRREDFLKGLAERYHGLYVDGNSGNSAAALSGALAIQGEGAESGRRRREPFPRWRIFVLAAIAALGLSRLTGFVSKGIPHSPFPIPLLLLLLTSCRGVESKLLIMEGNFLSSRGMYTDAIASYLKALEDPEAAPYASYGLGTVYAAMGETGAAMERYARAEKESTGRERSRELLYRLNYNRGILLFEQGKFDEAAVSFKTALEIDGARVEAKRNLELSLLSQESGTPPGAAAQSQTGEAGAENDPGTSALFDYLRAKEEEQWKTREWTEEEHYSGPDY